MWLLEIAPHILPAEDGEVAKAVASAFRENGVVVVVVLAASGRCRSAPLSPASSDLTSVDDRSRLLQAGEIAVEMEEAASIQGAHARRDVRPMACQGREP